MKEYILITGAAGGLGKAFAAECAARGYSLVLTDLFMNTLEPLANTLRRAHGVEVLCLSGDLTREDERDSLMAQLKERGIRLWGIINIAGLDFEGPFLQRTPRQIRTLLRLNVEAALELSLRALHLRGSGGIFRIVNVASMAGYYAMPQKALYSSSKRMLLSFSMALREELKGNNATVTVLCPSGMPTNAEVCRSIASQGLAGELTTKNVGYVAYKTMNCALRGGRVCVPGLLNRMILFVSRLVPPALVTKLIGARWAHTRGLAAQEGEETA